MYKPNESKLFGTVIKQLLNERNLSQRQFAKQSGLTTDYVSKLVNGVFGEPRQKNRRKIAKGLGLTEQELLEQIELHSHSAIEKIIPNIYSQQDLISSAIISLNEFSFERKFRIIKTSKYIAYRLKKTGEEAKTYQLILAQGQEGLCISISNEVLNPYLLELKFYDDAWISKEYEIPGYGYESFDSVECKEVSLLYWVIPSKEDIFFEISKGYKEIFSGQSIGVFYLDPKGIYPEEVIYKNINSFKIKRSEDSSMDWLFDHGDYLAHLDKSNCCVKIRGIHKLFPHTRQVYINSSEILEEFIHYFGEVLMENY